MANTVDKVIAIETNEIGYLEKQSKYKTNYTAMMSKTGGAGSDNVTKYWNDIKKEWQGQAWCACFQDWAFKQAYGEAEAHKLLCSDSWDFYTPTMAQRFKNKSQFFKTPKVGDLVFFQNSTRIHHVGLVIACTSKTFTTIEGNTSSGDSVVANGGAVCQKTYSLAKIGSKLAGFGRPAYSAQSSGTTKTVPGLAAHTIKKGAKGDNVKLLQKDLNYCGASLDVDGSAGGKTISALTAWQKKNGLSADGSYGPKSEAKMKTLLK